MTSRAAVHPSGSTSSAAAIDLACSRFRPDSELSALNRSAGQRVAVSPVFARALDVALRAAEMTDGDVDPTCGRSLVSLGYDKDFAELADDTSALTQPPAPAAGWRCVDFDAEDLTVQVPDGVLLDFGATAKALPADRAAHERETLADLSHRLRTPLTALRIDAESLSDDEEVTTRVIGDVDALTRTVNEIIAEARRPAGDGVAATCDATAVVGDRAAYWRALAEDQERWMTVELPPFSLPVRVAEQDLAACVDILLENVFAHTPDGTALSVRASPRAAGGAWIVVSDNGLGFSNPDSSRRGLSSAGSTGLGLDIARRIAEGSGGTLTLGRSPGGGGAVTIGLGPASRQLRKPRRHIKTRRPLGNPPADDDELFGPPERFRAG